MDLVGRERIENDRSRLLAAVFVVLAGFAILAAFVSLVGPDFVEPLTRTPLAVRLGLLALVLAFIALVSERERTLRKAQEVLNRQELIITAFQSRLEALHHLLDACNRVNSAVSVDGVLDVIAETAVELAGVQSGRVDTWDNVASDSGLRTTRVRTHPRWDRRGARFTLQLPLLSGDKQLGEIQLLLKEGETTLEPSRLDAVTRFASEAGLALEKARLLAHEQAANVHLEAEVALATSPDPAEVPSPSTPVTTSHTPLARRGRKR